VGIDYRNANYLYGNGDVIRIVRADFVNAEISALDIPRGIQVDIPDVYPARFGCSEATTGWLSQAFFYGTEGMGCSDAPGFGAGLLARTLEHNFGVRVENYVVVNMWTFGLAIDAIGGVPIYVFDTIDDRQRAGLPAIPTYGYFQAGNHWLSGIEAVRYARIRSIGGIFGRHDRQNELLVQLREQILKPSIVTKIPGLIDAFYGRVQTDLSLEQVTQLACLGLELTMDDIHFLGLPSELFVEGYNQRGVSALFADMDVISDMIADFVAGRPLEVP
jgi:LCP family protein required for cell wall assembly